LLWGWTMNKPEQPSTPDPCPQKASRRGSIIPKKWIPYMAVAATVCTFLGAELSTDLPWTPARYFTVSAAILGILSGGAVLMRK
jgi:hypothetical protein